MQTACLIIPCFNEAKRFRREPILDFLKSHASVSFCFVNDGSRDETLSMLEKLRNESDRILVLNLEKNSGKAEAVRSGMLHAHALNRFALLGYWDADLSTPLTELPRMIACMQEGRVKGVLGSRVKRLGSRIERKTSRHILGRIFSTFSNWILKFPVYDSQCGAKLFSADLTGLMFNDRFITKWLFDVELLARIRNRYGSDRCNDIIAELPLQEWKDIKGSKFRLKDYLQVPLDLLKVYFHYNR